MAWIKLDFSILCSRDFFVDATVGSTRKPTNKTEAEDDEMRFVSCLHKKEKKGRALYKYSTVQHVHR